jgi:cation diffusion facilitator family transporter
MAARAHDLSAFAHAHAFADDGRAGRELAVARVTVLTLVTMAVELLAGWWSGSLALTADGWHMGTHAFALGGAWAAYRWAQRAGDGYAFGGWKIEVLAAYTSGLMLLGAAAWIGIDALLRLRDPQPVDYLSAMWVACIGLAVNLASAWLLMRGDGHEASGRRAAAHRVHDHGHDQAHDHGVHSARDHHGHAHGHDVNYRAVMLHVLADALTSVLAIVALAGGAWFGWGWLDSAVALVGALVIGRWSFGVLGHSVRALTDATADPGLAQRIRVAIECDGDARISDLHVWQIGSVAWCAAIAVVADAPLSAAAYRGRLGAIPALRHVTVEVHRCPGCSG